MALVQCPECGKEVSSAAAACPGCGHPVLPAHPIVVSTVVSNQAVVSNHDPAPSKSNLLAGCLGFCLGPVGLWYKGQWAAGWAWLVMGVVLATSVPLLLPFLWVGMAVHAMVAKPKA